MKNKKIWLLGILLSLPVLSFAESEDSSYIFGLYIWELLCSVHVSIFFLKPLSDYLISQGKTKMTVWNLLLIRALVLLVATPIFPGIFILDFLTMFVGPFIGIKAHVNPSLNINEISTATNVSVKGQVTCPKCGRVMAYGNARCVGCGSSLEGVSYLCPKCQTVNLPTAQFCKSCGEKFASSMAPTTTPPQCPKCHSALLEKAKFCKYCGENVENIMANYVEVPRANAGMPLNKLAFDATLLNGTEENAIEAMIQKEMNQNPVQKGKTLPPLARKKVLVTMIYAIITFILISIYMAYHTYLWLGVVLWIIATWLYLKLISRFSIKKYIVKEVEKRPDEKISYITSSILSGATSSKSFSTIISILILVLLAGSIFVLYKEPRMIYEREGEGYQLRYYTYGLTSNPKKVVIPSSYKNKPVIAIRGDVFRNVHSVESVSLPDTIREIRGGAFQNCNNLRSINLPNGITEIHGSTFEGCESLESIVIPEGVTRIGGSAFRDCYSLTSAQIPESVGEIGSSAFRNTRISKVCISESAYVNERAFKNTYATIVYYEDDCEEQSYYGSSEGGYGYDYGE